MTLPLPALLTIQSGINQLRYATLKGIMAAKKKEIRKAARRRPPCDAADRALYVPGKGQEDRDAGGSPAEAAEELVAKLRDEARVIRVMCWSSPNSATAS